jgi:hypothetical protein
MNREFHESIEFLDHLSERFSRNTLHREIPVVAYFKTSRVIEHAAIVIGMK